MKIGTCKIEGCGFVGQMRKGMCNKHYRRWFESGTIRRTIRDPNEIIMTPDYALICVYDKEFNVINCAKIDIEDVDKINKYRWSLVNDGYLYSAELQQGLHNFIMNNDGSKLYDHRNINPLDNRKINLRECNKFENAQNRRTRVDNTSGAKGVCYLKRSNVFLAYICKEGVRKQIGYYKDVVSAAQAYNESALLYHGEFAKLNDIEALLAKVNSTDYINPVYNKISKCNTSGMKGVSWHNRLQKWHMQIMRKGIKITKYFDDAEEAAKAYRILEDQWNQYGHFKES